MNPSRRRLLRLGMVCLGLGPVGCSGTPEPPPGEPEKLSPGMEQMKADMIKQMQNKQFGRDLTKLPKAK